LEKETIPYQNQKDFFIGANSPQKIKHTAGNAREKELG